MKFGEKVKLLRNQKKLSQTELGKRCGLSLRTIRNYEVDGRYPKQRGVYSKLAAALECEVNYLLSEDESIVLWAPDCRKKAVIAAGLITDVSALFNSKELSEQEKDEVMRALQYAYQTAKERNKERYAPDESLEEN